MSPETSALLSIELRHLGGRLAQPREDEGAVASIAGQGLVMAVGIVPVPEALAGVRQGAEALVEALRPYSSSQAVKNFAERPASAEALYGASLPRLREIAAQWDPEGVIVGAHALV